MATAGSEADVLAAETPLAAEWPLAIWGLAGPASEPASEPEGARCPLGSGGRAAGASAAEGALPAAGGAA